MRRDPFARQELERTAYPRIGPYGMGPGECSWCGSKPRTLYQYATVPDDSLRQFIHRGYFCNLNCHDSYHT